MVGFRKDIGKRLRQEIKPVPKSKHPFAPFTITFRTPSCIDMAQFAMDAQSGTTAQAYAKLVARVLVTWTLSPEPPEDFLERLEMFECMDSPAAFFGICKAVYEAGEEERKNSSPA